MNAIFASSSQGTDGMLQALRDFDLAGQVFLYDGRMEAVGKLGLLVIPIKWGTWQWTLVDHIQGGNMPTIVDTGILVTMAISIILDL